MIQGSPEPRRLADRLRGLAAADAVARVWRGDYTLWGQRPDEIANRLGWLHLPETMLQHVPSLEQFADSVAADGIDSVALLGMGGSSLAPETLANALPHDGPRFAVLDTTHPDAVQRALDGFPPARTLFVVSTKSGTTSETLALFEAFYRNAVAVLGERKAGRQFVAITDPKSPLVDLAQERRFRRVFLNDPDVGGRYSALSLVGLVPAALLGLELKALLESARDMATRCAPSIEVERSPAACLAALLAAHADDGRNKATFALPKPLASLGAWLEQLVAESTGKCKKGIVPIVGESIGTAEPYSTDRVFVRLGAGSSRTLAPAIEIEDSRPETLGGQFFLWEFATALLGHLLAVNPFDQPDVESSKQLTCELLAAYRDRGESPSAPTTTLSAAALRAFASQAVTGDYIALLAFLDPRPDVTAALAEVRLALRDVTGCATTLGFGPRYLHSTGQLHKGDSGQGLFLEILDEAAHDVPIPDESGRPLTFGLLLRAQALGDAAALKACGRRVSVFDLGRSSPATLSDIARALRTDS